MECVAILHDFLFSRPVSVSAPHACMVLAENLVVIQALLSFQGKTAAIPV